MHPGTFLFFFLLAINSCNALPLVEKRQATGQSTTVTTMKEVTTLSGTMIETCIIKLTPIIDTNGQPAFEEVRTCTIEPASTASATHSAASSGTVSGTQSPQATTLTVVSTNLPPTATADPKTSSVSPSRTQSASATTTEASASSSPSESVPAQTSSADGNNGGASSTSSSPAQPSASAPPPPEVVSVPNVPASQAASSGAPATTAVGTSTASASPETSPSVGVSQVNNPASVPTPSAVVSDAPASGTAAGAEASETPAEAAAVVIPGQHVEVLPIGLGVFAGISVIALIVVGLVTYERTKYRKKFRQQKLAESGATMGYGGMAQRL